MTYLEITSVIHVRGGGGSAQSGSNRSGQLLGTFGR